MNATRMTPHRWRRALQLTNLGLAGLLLTTGLLVLLGGATAEARLEPEVRRGYERARSSGLRWHPAQPVGRESMGTVVWRYQAHRPAHWPFSGPLPPKPAPEAPTVIEAAPDLDALSQLGTVFMVAYDPDLETAIGFRFHATGKAASFAVGEIIRSSSEEAARFRLKAVEPARERVYHVLYDVLEDGQVRATKTYLHDSHGADSDDEGPIRPAPRAGPGAQPRGEAAKRTRLPRLEVLKPRKHVRAGNRYDRVVEFDDKTRAYFGGRGVAALGDLIKTAVVKDERTGQPLGVRITGMAKGLQADAFDIRRGDILVSINDQKVASLEDVVRIAKTLDPDSEDLVKVVIDRAGRLYTYRVDTRDPDTKRKLRYFTWD